MQVEGYSQQLPDHDATHHAWHWVSLQTSTGTPAHCGVAPAPSGGALKFPQRPLPWPAFNSEDNAVDSEVYPASIHGPI